MPETRTTKAIQTAKGTGAAYSDSLYNIASQNMEADYESKLYKIKAAERDTIYNAAIKATTLLGEYALTKESQLGHQRNIDALGKEEYQKSLESGEPMVDQYGVPLSEHYYDVKTGKTELKDYGIGGSWEGLSDKQKDWFRPKRTTGDVSFLELLTGTDDNRKLGERFKGFMENVGTYAGIEPQYEFQGNEFNQSYVSAKGKRASARLAGFKDDDPITTMQTSAKNLASELTDDNSTTTVNVNASTNLIDKPFKVSSKNVDEDEDWIYGGPQPQWIKDLSKDYE